MTKIVFLHIPKTAGQSVHAALVNGFGEENVAPARVNEQLARMTISELNRYKVFSGHLDWSLLDCIKGPKYVFTILREPMDRILSFYFFLRQEAAGLSPEELESPGRAGMKAALTLSAHEYFTGGPPPIRSFLNAHYDNFYAYYFAGRHYLARNALHGQLNRGIISRDRLLEMAHDNMSQLDGVFTVEQMPDVFAAIRRHADRPILDDEKYRTNVNKAVPRESRKDLLMGLGATQGTLRKIESYCDMDREIWQKHVERSQKN